MLGRARSVAVVGLEAIPVAIEAHIGGGLPVLQVIGASGTASGQAGDRVRTALAASGVQLPQCRILVSLAPADVPKAGARFDLPMAAAVAAANGDIPRGALGGWTLVGELSLDGSVRPVPGILPSAAAAALRGARRFACSEAAAAEAALVPDLSIVPLRDLAELLAVARGVAPVRPVPAADPTAPSSVPDLADVRGQVEARRALAVAAAGGHHLLLVGPPGCGKSMLAHRLPGLLPPLTDAHALELAAVRSVAGLPATLDHRPPLRAPHHGVSVAALLGGGTGVARPGEVSLAHRGVLLLDELFEWPRSVLESLRAPLEDGLVRVARTRATVVYPAAVQLVCAANPCPCGGGGRCVCGLDKVLKYRARLSGPLADRLDLAPQLEPLSAAQLLARDPGESTAVVGAVVAAARAATAARWGPGSCNARVAAAQVRPTASATALAELGHAVDVGLITGRGFDKALRVARTIADLDGQEVIGPSHVAEALGHRYHLAAGTGSLVGAA